MFDKLFDLPAHPLLIHAPIVLLPIAAIVTIVLAVKPTWRAAAGWWPLALLGVVVVVLVVTQKVTPHSVPRHTAKIDVCGDRERHTTPRSICLV